MAKTAQLKPEFVEHIPQNLDEGTIYISIEFATAIHKCCCGCGSEIVTPFSPIQWQLTFDGKSVTLYPSIGNWGLPCRSHYWVKQNNVVWSYQMTESEILAGRSYDAAARRAYNEGKDIPDPAEVVETLPKEGNRRWSLWNWIAEFFG